jgi:hypothetical protein
MTTLSHTIGLTISTKIVIFQTNFLVPFVSMYVAHVKRKLHINKPTGTVVLQSPNNSVLRTATSSHLI